MTLTPSSNIGIHQTLPQNSHQPCASLVDRSETSSQSCLASTIPRPPKDTLQQREVALRHHHMSEHTKLSNPYASVTLYKDTKPGWTTSHQMGSHRHSYIEVRKFHQYLVRVDGSGRHTLRNRKFLRKYTPTHPSPPPRAHLPPPLPLPTQVRTIPHDASPSPYLLEVIPPPASPIPPPNPTIPPPTPPDSAPTVYQLCDDRPA